MDPFDMDMDGLLAAHNGILLQSDEEEAEPTPTAEYDILVGGSLDFPGEPAMRPAVRPCPAS